MLKSPSKLAIKLFRKFVLKRKLIFIVEDNMVYAHSLRSYLLLQFPEAQILILPDGETCLIELHRKPLLIIMDHLLNTKHEDAATGLNIIQTIKSASFKTNMILLSSNTDLNVFVKTLALYKCTYLRKDNNAFRNIANLIKHLK